MGLSFAATANSFGLMEATSRATGLMGRDTDSHFSRLPQEKSTQACGCLIQQLKIVCSAASSPLRLRIKTKKWEAQILKNRDMHTTEWRYGRKVVSTMGTF